MFPPCNSTEGWKVRAEKGTKMEWMDSNVSCEQVEDERAGEELEDGKDSRRRHSAPAAQAAGKGKMNTDDAADDAGGDGAKKDSAEEEEGEREEALTEEGRAMWWKDTVHAVKELLGALRLAEILA